MRRLVDKKELRAYWRLDHWYEKTIYVIGISYIALLIFAFAVGFADSLIQ